MTCSLCDPNSQDPRRMYMCCWCNSVDWKGKGYDAFIASMSTMPADMLPTVRDAFYSIPEDCPVGSKERRDWLEGWQKAREEA